MRFFDKIIQYGILLFVFLIPWQARWIISIGKINGGEPARIATQSVAGGWEYGTQSLYATEILLAGILVLLLVSCWSERQRAIASQNFLRWILSLRSRMTTPAGILLLFLIYAGVSIFWSIDKNTALIHWRFLVEAGAVFLLVGALVGTRPSNSAGRRGAFVQKIQWAIILSAIVQVVFAVAQSHMQYIPAATELGMAAQQASNLGTSVIETINGRWLRAYGTFPHPNILGAWLTLSLILTIRKIQDTRYKIQTLFLYSSFTIILFGLLLTFSRSAWLAFGVFLVIVILSHPTPRLRVVNWIRSRLVPRSFSARGRIPAVIHETPRPSTSAGRQARGDGFKLLALTILIITIFAAIFPDPFLSRLLGGQARFSSNRLEVKSNTERVASWQEGIEIIKKHPILGVGVGNYGLAVQRDIVGNQPAWYYQPSHNIFLLIWSELGLIGIFLLVLIMFLSFRPPRAYSGQAGVEESLMQDRKISTRDPSTPLPPASLREALRAGRSARDDILFLLPLLVLSLFDHYLWSLYPGMMIGVIWLKLAKNK